MQALVYQTSVKQLSIKQALIKQLSLKKLSLISAVLVLLFSSIAHAEVKILMETSEGDIHLSLDEKKAPITVENFVSYVNSGFYDGTIFHRVIKGFMIQGGGFDEKMTQKKTKKMIKNESTNGLQNKVGTIAMARRNDPHSATSQFFINHSNNDSLNAKENKHGYTVFGKVTKGMDVLNNIANVSTTTKKGHQNVPINTVLIKKVTVVSAEEAKQVDKK
jgi:cyclophilin family peptidyl-prolyl cis-trans isomerase